MLDVLGNAPSGVDGLPCLVRLPARGPGGGAVGRTLAILDGMPAGLEPHGWRLRADADADLRRARSLLRADLEALAIAAHGYTGPAGRAGAGAVVARGERVAPEVSACSRIRSRCGTSSTRWRGWRTPRRPATRTRRVGGVLVTSRPRRVLAGVCRRSPARRRARSRRRCPQRLGVVATRSSADARRRTVLVGAVAAPSRAGRAGRARRRPGSVVVRRGACGCSSPARASAAGPGGPPSSFNRAGRPGDRRLGASVGADATAALDVDRGGFGLW